MALGSVSGHLSFLSRLLTGIDSSFNHSSSVCSLLNPSIISKHSQKSHCKRNPFICAAESSDLDGSTSTRVLQDSSISQKSIPQDRRSADWKAVRAYCDSGHTYEGRIEGFNAGGLLVRVHSLVGFLPFPQLSPSHFCKEPSRSLQEMAKGLTGSLIAMKVIQADEQNRKLIFSEKEAVWSKFSGQVKVGDVFKARVGSLEDFGAFVHLRFPDGLYHLTGLVHVSEVSWDLVQDVRDVLTVGDEIMVKIISIDRDKSRITLSIRQLEEDPLLETMDKVIAQEERLLNAGSVDMGINSNIEPLPGLETIFKELLQEDGIDDIRISRQGFERRVVSQDLQLWLSNERDSTRRYPRIILDRQINASTVRMRACCSNPTKENGCRDFLHRVAWCPSRAHLPPRPACSVGPTRLTPCRPVPHLRAPLSYAIDARAPGYSTSHNLPRVTLYIKANHV